MASESEKRLEQAFLQMMDVMAEVKYELIKNREERATFGEERATFREEREDLKGFVQEITRRNEVVHREVIDVLRDFHREVVGELRDLRAETQANTREILSRLPDAA